jgi:hypothetical protein
MLISWCLKGKVERTPRAASESNGFGAFFFYDLCLFAWRCTFSWDFIAYQELKIFPHEMGSLNFYNLQRQDPKKMDKGF